MKILFIINTLCCGGAERFVFNMSQQMFNDGNDVYVLVFSNKNPYYVLPDNIHVIDLHRTRFFDLGMLWRLRKEILRIKPHQILTVMTSVTAQTLMALLFTNYKITARECNCHKFLLDCCVKKIMYKIFLFFTLNNCKKVICQSFGMKNDLENIFNIKKDKLVVINNPVNISKSIILSKEPCEHKWLNNKEYCVGVTCANLTKYKDYGTLLWAFNILKQYNRYKLIVIGAGYLREDLLRLRDQLELHDTVDFIGTVNNPFKYYRKADFFVLSSHMEASPNVLLEAMLCGTTVISTDAPYGPGEIIKHGVNGFLVEPKNPNKMAETILYATQSDTHKIRENAVKDIYENYSLEKIAKQYYQVL